AQSMYEESLRVALEADETEHACRAYINLISDHLENLRLTEARRRLQEGIDLAETAEFLTYSGYLQMELGMLHFATGNWDEVAAVAWYAVESPPPLRCAALIVIGRTRLRRGEPAGVEMLREAWQLAVGLREPQRLGPAACALAEAAWLDGDASAALTELTQAF